MADAISVSRDWRLIKIKGPLDFSLTGVIAEIAAILKVVNIPIFVLSTYNTDYFLVKHDRLSAAVKALGETGHTILFEK